METQCKVILNFMRDNGSITSMDAFRFLDITRLSARIKDLRDEGYNIETNIEHKNGKRYARYSLKEEQPDPFNQSCSSK